MKKLYPILCAVTLALFASCANNAGSSSGSGTGSQSNKTAPEVSTWYSFTTTAEGKSSAAYVYIGEDGKVSRCGSDKGEYKNGTTSYTVLKNKIDSEGISGWTKCDEPSWGGVGTEKEEMSLGDISLLPKDYVHRIDFYNCFEGKKNKFTLKVGEKALLYCSNGSNKLYKIRISSSLTITDYDYCANGIGEYYYIMDAKTAVPEFTYQVFDVYGEDGSELRYERNCVVEK